MREIIFRGKAINRKKGFKYRTKYKNGDWVYGLVIRLYDERFPLLPAEMVNEDGISGIEVDHKSIGQYTGLTDKNGTKIFEGDILKTKYGRLCKVEWVSSPCDVCWDLTPIETKHEYADEYDLWRSINLEVIGNIHDNPELLEESK